MVPKRVTREKQTHVSNQWTCGNLEVKSIGTEHASQGPFTLQSGHVKCN